MKNILNNIDKDNIIEHIKKITTISPNRISGQGQDDLASEYIVNKLNSYGIETEIESFYAYNSKPGNSKLFIEVPYKKEIESVACLHIEGTPPNGVEAELVYIGAGSQEDYEGKNVKDKIVLVEVSYSPATPEKAKIASDKGALGMIIMNWGLEEKNLIPMRALKSVWGNPTSKTWDEMPEIFAVTTTKKDGVLLKELCEKEKVVVKVFAESKRSWELLKQPIGHLKTGNNKEIIISGHLDAWDPGVTDNTSGIAVILEIARLLSENKENLNTNVKFCFWNGHEIAEAAGSTFYSDKHWNDLNKNTIAYINIDSPGMIDTDYFLISYSEELENIISKNLSEMPKKYKKVGLSKIADQSFLGVGIPSISGRLTHSDEKVKEWNGATFGWWNHTSEDTFDKFDINNAIIETRFWLNLVFSLATSNELPFDIPRKLKALSIKIEKIKSSDILISKKLEQVKFKIATITKLLVQIQPLDQSQLKDQVIMKINSKLSPLYSSAVSKYQQDRYGSSDLEYDVPTLHSLYKYEESKSYLLYTDSLRSLNYLINELDDMELILSLYFNKEEKNENK